MYEDGFYCYYLKDGRCTYNFCDDYCSKNTLCKNHSAGPNFFLVMGLILIHHFGPFILKAICVAVLLYLVIKFVRG